MRTLAIALGLQIAFALVAAEDDLQISRKPHTITPLIDEPSNTNIVRLTAEIFKRQHYLKDEKRFDNSLASEFLDRYLESLDNLRIYFLQSDAAEFDHYRTELDELTVLHGDSSPARTIFDRFRQRVHQQHEYVTNSLATEKFDFTTDDRFPITRKNLPRPKDLDEAKRLWRDRLRYEYLQEKLAIARPDAITKIISEKLTQKKPKEIASALVDKLSKEKAAAVAKIIEDKWEQASADDILKAVSAKLEADNAAEIVKTITRRYGRVLRTIDDYDNDDALEIYLTSLARVFDPHSDYMGKSQLENFNIGMKLSLFGIGALLRSEDGICKIQSLTGGGPAEKSGLLKPNDKIIAVAQATNEAVDVVDMKLNKVVELIRGPKDTEVRLTVIPADAADPSVRKIITLVRDEIKLEDQEAKARIFETPQGEAKTMRLGYINLPSFYSSFELEGRRGGGPGKSTTSDVSNLVRKLVKEGVGGLILDLRQNGGGSLEEAIRLTGLFIKDGPVVQVREFDGKIEVDADPDPKVHYDGPLVVLTSRFSASASEILAAALQDYGRALVIGDNSTHGKGTVQSLIQLGPILRNSGVNLKQNAGAVKITIRKFYRASGLSTQLEGVTPDLILPHINNYAEVGERQLENALKCDRIPPAEHQFLNRVAPVLDELKKRSEARRATDRDFAYLNEEIERYRKALDEKSVSLNESTRLKEKKDADDRAKARRKELAARPEPPGKIYEFSLKDVDKPGLPAPLAKTNKLSASTSSTNGAKSIILTKENARLDLKKESAPDASDVAAAPVVKPVDPLSDDADEETVPDDKVVHLDITLEEVKRILIDYINLQTGAKSLANTAALNGK